MARMQLDHIVLLLPYSDIVKPPPWLTSAFTISPGGQHGDGKTENKLIVFRDGTYIELIAFTSDAARAGHWWGDKGHGIIDYAFTLARGADDYPLVEKRIRAAHIADALKPQPLVGGSRTKPDGEKIEWRVAFPPAAERGRAPFYCFDVTPRVRRVSDDESLTTHPCGALGVASLTISTLPGSQDKSDLAALLDATLLQQPQERVDAAAWNLPTPRKITAQAPSQFSIMEANEQHEKAALQSSRNLVCRLALFTERQSNSLPSVNHVVQGDEIRIDLCSI